MCAKFCQCCLLHSKLSTQSLHKCMLSQSIRTCLPLLILDTHEQVLKTDAQKAFTMLKKMTVEPSEVGTPKASKNAMIPLDFLKRAKVV